MDPFSALSVATAVVQFLDFTEKVFSKTYEIYTTTSENPGQTSGIRNIAENLISLNRKLRTSIQDSSKLPFSTQDEQIGKLGEQCIDIGERLVTVLTRIQFQSKHKLWTSFRQALSTMWRQSEIDALQKALENHRQQISMLILVSLRERIGVTESNQSNQTSKMQISLDEIQTYCKKTLQAIAGNVSWQNDLVRAINQSYVQGSMSQEACAPPATTHKVLHIKDVQRIQKLLMHHLQYRGMNNRYEQISLAYKKTFDWMFRPSPTSTNKWADFVEWIKSDDLLYWITGKAGSGKSTLMRFINDHERTEQALRTWASSKTLVKAYFFFWSSGSEIQMSSEGLVRTLLHQLLQQIPGLIPHVLPHRVELGMLFSRADLKELPWTWEELLKAFKTFVDKLKETTKIVILIDGLDEFKGKPADLISWIASLGAPHVKICVSSRPWIAFEDAFGTLPHLRLEDLTYDDINYYITSKLSASTGFLVLKKYDQQFASQLIDNVCSKSSGVFLWVTLVTKSLLEGVAEGERLSDLQKRLNSLPPDLEGLFRKILANLDTTHLVRASQLFQILRASLLPISLLSLSFADEDDPEIASKTPSRVLSTLEADFRGEFMRRRIIASCKGLLEVVTNNDAVHDRDVTYLHRSVKDYLEQADVWTDLCLATDEQFNVNLRLCNSAIMQIKSKSPEQYRLGKIGRRYIRRLGLHGIEYGVRADPECSKHQIRLLNEIDRAITILTPHSMAHWTDYWTYFGIDTQIDLHFLEFAVRHGLDRYVQASLSTVSKHTISKLLHSSLIMNVFISEIGNSSLALGYERPPSRALVKTLLDCGADPNYLPSMDKFTVWEVLVLEYIRTDIFDEFLLHGANPRTMALDSCFDTLDDNLQKLVKQKKRETRLSHYLSKLHRRT